jgi:hypothetical protein
LVFTISKVSFATNFPHIGLSTFPTSRTAFGFELYAVP